MVAASFLPSEPRGRTRAPPSSWRQSPPSGRASSRAISKQPRPGREWPQGDLAGARRRRRSLRPSSAKRRAGRCPASSTLKPTVSRSGRSHDRGMSPPIDPRRPNMANMAMAQAVLEHAHHFYDVGNWYVVAECWDAWAVLEELLARGKDPGRLRPGDGGHRPFRRDDRHTFTVALTPKGGRRARPLISCAGSSDTRPLGGHVGPIPEKRLQGFMRRARRARRAAIFHAVSSERSRPLISRLAALERIRGPIKARQRRRGRGASVELPGGGPAPSDQATSTHDPRAITSTESFLSTPWRPASRVADFASQGSRALGRVREGGFVRRRGGHSAWS